MAENHNNGDISTSNKNKDDDILSDDNKVTEQQNKPVRLSLHLIVRRNLCKDVSGIPQDEIIEQLNQVKRVRLDRENIEEIDSLELLSANVSHLYLQKNRIKCIENLEYLPNLQVLVLSKNSIKSVEGISHLEKLVFLDLSNNSIEKVEVDEIPKNVVILNFSGNECVADVNHRKRLVEHLPQLKNLDGSDISKIGPLYMSNDAEESDEGEDSEDEADVIEDLPPAEPIPVYSQLSAYKKLPKIGASIQEFATEMLLRSQARLEETMGEHRQHCQAITNSKIKAQIRPMRQIRKPE